MAWSHTLAAHAHKVHRRYEQKHTKPLRGSWLVFARFEQLCARRPRTLHRPVCMRRHGGTFQLLTPSMRIQTNPRSASETQPVAELASATVGPARTCAGVEPRRRQARLIRIGMLVLAASAHAMLHEWKLERLHDTSLRSRALGLFLLSTRPMSCRISLKSELSDRTQCRTRKVSG